ncbi:phosphatidate cytidylyltransferase [Tolypothrix sp. PCC 7601]|nr:phosphatidate cytidylyltransferase [Tolypothrix sp. PCC 7601]
MRSSCLDSFIEKLNLSILKNQKTVTTVIFSETTYMSFITLIIFIIFS